MPVPAAVSVRSVLAVRLEIASVSMPPVFTLARTAPPATKVTTSAPPDPKPVPAPIPIPVPVPSFSSGASIKLE